MSMRECKTRRLLTGGAVVAGLLAAAAGTAQAEGKGPFGLGAPVEEGDLAGFTTVQPDGRGLPPGSGNVAQGAEIYAQQCAACHGEKLEGNPAEGIGGPVLIGGRGSLASEAPKKTVESYWPYAPTLFDYVKRSMPFTSPGSLSDEEVYAVSAYILAEAGIVAGDATLDAESLAAVEMPNRNGFIPDPRPEHQLYR
ncbi:cytochrome c [Geminicoccaceae bacterium 1502E]|nr:cytochrome c [Geminicoccaceae bacterium 1502E]